VDRKSAASLGQAAGDFYDAISADKRISVTLPEHFAALTDDLKRSLRPVVICGTDIVPDPVPGLAADLALLLRTAERNAGLFYLMPGGNAFGAGLLSDDEASLLNIIEAIENGDVKALILVESDPFFHFSDRKRLEHALDALDLLIVLDYINSDAAQKAHIFMPSSTLYEADGIFVNQEGRAQMVRQAYSGGIPIVQSGGGDHPPRIYGTGIPGADSKPAWLIMVELADDKIKPENKTLPATIHQWLADIAPELADVNLTAGLPDEGIRLNSGVNTDLRFNTDFSRQPEQHQGSTGNLKLIFTDLTFGSEALSVHSECLWELEPEPAVIMHTSEAESLNLSDGDPVAIQTESGNLEAKLQVVANMAAGVLVVPRHRKLSWQIFETGMSSIGRDQIKKVTA
jgi:NADH-quinone oxidoreductase subunit G